MDCHIFLSTLQSLQTNLNQKLTICSKLCFAIGGAPKEVTSSASAFFLQIYLLDVAQINPFQASLVLFIGRVWGAVTDPVIGFLITKSSWTKIGRLMPWILGCTPFLVVSYFCLWFVPPFINGRFVWYLVFYCLYQTLINCFHVSYSALTMFISTDQKERDSATAYRMTVEVMGTLLGAAVQGQIVASAHTQKHCSPHNMSKEVYLIAAGVIGAVFLLCTLVMFLGVKEKLPPSAASPVTLFGTRCSTPSAPIDCAAYLISFRIKFLKCFTHHLLRLVTLQVSALFSIPFWQWFLKRFGKKTAAFCGITWIMPFSMMLVFIPNLVVAYIVAVSSGLSIAASLLLPWSMLPDVVDDFRLTNSSSKGHEAIFYSFYVFFVKLAAGITLGVSTLCLQFAGYETRGCSQPPPVVYTLKLLIGAAPIAFIVTGLMILVLYPINEDLRWDRPLGPSCRSAYNL
uniref:MFSD2 lysolipid transporter B, sphingolipid n=1 Tax=Xiphophorus couchianus TaxID=32473 RepID=A0A3B5LR39_9TELE